MLQEAAQKMGIDQGELHDKLAQMLPQAVDHATPDGTPPVDDGRGFNLASLWGAGWEIARLGSSERRQDYIHHAVDIAVGINADGALVRLRRLQRSELAVQ